MYDDTFLFLSSSIMSHLDTALNAFLTSLVIAATSLLVFRNFLLSYCANFRTPSAAIIVLLPSRKPNCLSDRSPAFFISSNNLFPISLSWSLPNVSSIQIGLYEVASPGVLLGFGIRTSLAFFHISGKFRSLSSLFITPNIVSRSSFATIFIISGAMPSIPGAFFFFHLSDSPI